MTVGRKRKYDKGLPNRMVLRRGTYYYIVPPKRVKEFGGKTWINLGKDERLAHHRYGDCVAPQAQTLEMAWAEYQKTPYFQQNSPRTQKDKRSYWSKYLGETFGHMAPNEVEPPDVSMFMRKMGTNAVQANRSLSLLSHMYTLLVEWGEAERNPCTSVRKLPEKARTRYVTDATLGQWLNHCRPMLAIFSELAYLTGVRAPDLQASKHTDIDDAGIHIVASKTGKRSVIPWTEALHEVVDAARSLRRRGVPRLSPYLFPNKRGEQYTASGFRAIWTKDMGTFPGERFAISDLRAKHATDLENAGGDATRNLGHSSRALTSRHYLRGEAVVRSLK